MSKIWIIVLLGIALVLGGVCFLVFSSKSPFNYNAAVKQVRVEEAQAKGGVEKKAPIENKKEEALPVSTVTFKNEHHADSVVPKEFVKKEENKEEPLPTSTITSAPTASEEPAPIQYRHRANLPVPNQILGPTPLPPEMAVTTNRSGDRSGSELLDRSGRFLFNNQVDDGNPFLDEENKKEQINPAYFMPDTSDIWVVSSDAMMSRNEAFPVVASVIYPVYTNGKLVLTRGDRLKGTVSAGTFKNFLTIKFSKIIYKNRKSVEIKAFARDGETLAFGVKGFPVGNAFLSAIPVLLTEMSKGVLEGLNQGNTTTTTSALGTQTAQSKSIIWSGVTSGGQAAFEKLSEMLVQDLEQDRPYTMIYPGTLFKVQLDAGVDLSKAEYETGSNTGKLQN